MCVRERSVKTYLNLISEVHLILDPFHEIRVILIGHVERLKNIIQLKLVIIRELILVLATASRYKASVTVAVTSISSMINKAEEIAFWVDTSLALDDSHLIEVLEHLGTELVNDPSDFRLQVLPHLLEHEHILGKEQTHQPWVHQLMIPHEVVTWQDANVRVKGEEDEEDKGPQQLRQNRQLSTK